MDVSEQSSARIAAEFFQKVAWKHLKTVDLPHGSSNQHEIGGVNRLRDMLGYQRMNGLRTRWRIFDDSDNLVETIEYENLTWYNSRKNPARSPEWRLYYPAGRTPLASAEVGDLLLIARPGHVAAAADFDLLCYIVPQASTLHDQILWALGIGAATEIFQVESPRALDGQELRLFQRETLEALEPELRLSSPSQSLAERIAVEFADFLDAPLASPFPSTGALAEFAHDNLSVPVESHPDNALTELLDIESRAFYALETALLEKRLEAGFDTVEEFLSFSLSVQNRRKARRGRSLENHLSFIFRTYGIVFEEQVVTEHSSVDFLFPGKHAYELYRQTGQPSVIMLAAKSSCKDRWRQVLNEAQALERKYLFTLEAAISPNQTGEMGTSGVTLVVPRDLITSYDTPGTEILDLAAFINLVRNSTSQES